MPTIQFVPAVVVRHVRQDTGGKSLLFLSMRPWQEAAVGLIVFGPAPTYTDGKLAVTVRTLEPDTYRAAAGQFAADLARKSQLVGTHAEAARSLFEKTLNRIKVLQPVGDIVVGLAAASESIYFRFYNPQGHETHLEVFYTKDDEDDQVEAVTTVYRSEAVVLKRFGTLEQVFGHLAAILPPDYPLTPTFVHELSLAVGTTAHEPIY